MYLSRFLSSRKTFFAAINTVQSHGAAVSDQSSLKAEAAATRRGLARLAPFESPGRGGTIWPSARPVAVQRRRRRRPRQGPPKPPAALFPIPDFRAAIARTRNRKRRAINSASGAQGVASLCPGLFSFVLTELRFGSLRSRKRLDHGGLRPTATGARIVRELNGKFRPAPCRGSIKSNLLWQLVGSRTERGPHLPAPTQNTHPLLHRRRSCVRSQRAHRILSQVAIRVGAARWANHGMPVKKQFLQFSSAHRAQGMAGFQ